MQSAARPCAAFGHSPRLHLQPPRLRRLTEFSCGAHSDGRSTADHTAFMRAVVPLLEAAPFVQRYFWMAARDMSGLRNLVVAGSSGPASALTPLGRLYLSL